MQIRKNTYMDILTKLISIFNRNLNKTECMRIHIVDILRYRNVSLKSNPKGQAKMNDTYSYNINKRNN